jgi:hypothetical protein
MTLERREALLTQRFDPASLKSCIRRATARDAALTASAEIKFISRISLAATVDGWFSQVTRFYPASVARQEW